MLPSRNHLTFSKESSILFPFPHLPPTAIWLLPSGTALVRVSSDLPVLPHSVFFSLDNMENTCYWPLRPSLRFSLGFSDTLSDFLPIELSLYLFAKTAATNYHKRDGFRQQKFILTVLEARVRSVSLGWYLGTSKTVEGTSMLLRRTHSLPFPPFGSSRHSLVVATSLQSLLPSIFTLPSPPCMSSLTGHVWWLLEPTWIKQDNLPISDAQLNHIDRDPFVAIVVGYTR